MTAKRVLVALDTSEQADRVFEQALEQAQSEGSGLMIMHVLQVETNVEANPLVGLGTLADTNMYGTLQRLRHEQVEQEIEKVKAWLDSYVQRAEEKQIATELSYATGIPGPQICDRARDWRADLVVLGRRGVHGIREVVLGSVSNYVLHHAPCSVLVVQGQLLQINHS
jgi:nucleotide-binding universal stress UspA family protein